MIAGRDTTAALLGWCLVRLALHPDIYSSLRATCLRDFPSDTQPDFAQLKSCRPLQHFIQEVLRLHPPVPVNNRLCVKDTTLPLGGGPDQSSPIAVRAGQPVVFSVYMMHKRKDLWGEDALEFRPSRWERKVPPWQWLPFLGGPRVCLGQQFALTEAGFLLVRLLREFDAVQAVDESEMRKMKKGLGLTMCKLGIFAWGSCSPADPVLDRAWRRSESALPQGALIGFLARSCPSVRWPVLQSWKAVF
jgi:cytochrome P450